MPVIQKNEEITGHTECTGWFRKESTTLKMEK